MYKGDILELNGKKILVTIYPKGFGYIAEDCIGNIYKVKREITGKLTREFKIWILDGPSLPPQ